MFIPPKISYDTVLVSNNKMKKDVSLIIQGNNMHSNEQSIRNPSMMKNFGRQDDTKDSLGWHYVSQNQSYLK